MVACALAGCGATAPDVPVVSFPASAVGAEAELLREQVARFERNHPGVRVVLRRTPDAADQRRQLYVQWLNARMPDPDVLQLDVVWTAEFAAAGWLQPLDTFGPDTRDFTPVALRANRWRGALYALPWFVDVGLLYWRTDLLERAPATYAELVDAAQAAQAREQVRHGLVWQGARYEGLVTVFLEYLVAHGGALFDADGRVALDAPPARAALRAMRDALDPLGVVPRQALTWHEEEVRFAFQTGQALFMRNWPYAHALLRDPARSRVAGRFGVALMPPAAPGGAPAAALGGAQLALNAHSDAPQGAWQLIEFLTAPEQMRERAARLGQLPPRRSLLRDDVDLPLGSALAAEALRRAVARPATPVYAQLSSLLQVELHRALSGQSEPDAALARAARRVRELLRSVELDASGPDPEPSA